MQQARPVLLADQPDTYDALPDPKEEEMTEQQLAAAFDVINRRCGGDTQEMQKVLSGLGARLHEEEVREFMAIFDPQGKGLIPAEQAGRLLREPRDAPEGAVHAKKQQRKAGAANKQSAEAEERRQRQRKAFLKARQHAQAHMTRARQATKSRL